MSTAKEQASLETLTQLFTEAQARLATPVEQLAYAERLIRAQAAAIKEQNSALAALAPRTPTAPSAPKAAPAATAPKAPTAAAATTPAGGRSKVQADVLAEYNAIDPNDAKARAAYRDANAAELGLK